MRRVEAAPCRVVDSGVATGNGHHRLPNPVAEDIARRARHAGGGLAGGDKAQRSVIAPESGQGPARRALGVYGRNRRRDDRTQMLVKLTKADGRLGVDQ